MDLDTNILPYLVEWVYSNNSSGLLSSKNVKELRKAFSASTDAGKEAHSMPIYRGLTITESEMESLLLGKKIRMARKKYESWTIDPNIALYYAVESGFFGAVLSKKRPKRNTVLIDVTNDDLQEMLEEYYSDDVSEDDLYYDDEPTSIGGQFFQFMQMEQEIIVKPQCDSCDLSDLECLVFTGPSIPLSLYGKGGLFRILPNHAVTKIVKESRNGKAAILDLPSGVENKNILNDKKLWESLLFSPTINLSRVAGKLRWKHKFKRRYNTDWSAILNGDLLKS